jgi:hypothetical protein
VPAGALAYGLVLWRLAPEVVTDLRAKLSRPTSIEPEDITEVRETDVVA